MEDQGENILTMSLVEVSGMCFCALHSYKEVFGRRKCSLKVYFNIILQNADDNKKSFFFVCVQSQFAWGIV